MSDEDAFGAELVVQDDGKESTSTSAQITPRASNLTPQSFSYSNNSNDNKNNNNNGNSNQNTVPSNNNTGMMKRVKSDELRVGTAEPGSATLPSNSKSAPGSTTTTNSRSHMTTFQLGDQEGGDDDQQQHSSTTMTSASYSNIKMVSSMGASSFSGAHQTTGGGGINGNSTRDAFGSPENNNGMKPQQPSRTIPGQHPGMYLSFSSIPGGRSVMGGNPNNNQSTVSNYFGKDDVDDDSRRPSPAFGAKGNDKDKGKVLPAPELDMDEVEEELQGELLRCVTEQTTSCNLSRLQIQRIPQEVRCFSWLRELLLGDNSIAILPDTIFLQMQQLEVLDLMENKLTTVPRSVFQLRNLKKVLLDHNKIADLPDDIDPDPIEQFGLPELVEVGLEWNALRRFPINFLKYAPKLERLFLSENPGISHLPPPKLIEERTSKEKIRIRLDNRPMLLQAAAANKIYSPSAGFVDLHWNKIYPDRVLDYLYLGSMRTAQCVEVYQDLDIGYVLTAARNLDVVLGPGMKHLTLPFDDLPGEDISHFFELSFKFIDEAVGNKKGILIHCFAGLSRSVAMTMGYLMKKYRITADDGLKLVRQSRPPAHPNDGFVQRLRGYTKELGITDEESQVNFEELSIRNLKNSSQASATTGAAMNAAKEEEEAKKKGKC